MPTYISQAGLEELKTEYQKRKTTTRKEIAERIAAAKELGDLSENFEYHEAKEQQGLNEANILELEAKINDAVIIKASFGEDLINIGTTFVVELDGQEKTFELVGSTEANPLEGRISNESPLGQAFIGHKTGESIEVELPVGVKQYKIKKIK
jgi:transcription elongation factor GreA